MLVVLSLLPFILFLIFFIIVVTFIYRYVKRSERRADERLAIEKKRTQYQQEQQQLINELSQRVTRIESLLKEVE